jgi:hypothetical protein
MRVCCDRGGELQANDVLPAHPAFPAVVRSVVMYGSIDSTALSRVDVTCGFAMNSTAKFGYLRSPLSTALTLNEVGRSRPSERTVVEGLEAAVGAQKGSLLRNTDGAGSCNVETGSSWYELTRSNDPAVRERALRIHSMFAASYPSEGNFSSDEAAAAIHPENDGSRRHLLALLHGAVGDYRGGVLQAILTAGLATMQHGFGSLSSWRQFGIRVLYREGVGASAKVLREAATMRLEITKCIDTTAAKYLADGRFPETGAPGGATHPKTWRGQLTGGPSRPCDAPGALVMPEEAGPGGSEMCNARYESYFALDLPSFRSKKESAGGFFDDADAYGVVIRHRVEVTTITHRQGGKGGSSMLAAASLAAAEEIMRDAVDTLESSVGSISWAARDPRIDLMCSSIG